MPPINPATLNVDLTRIENAEVRRAIRQLIQQLQEVITQQQVQIEALVEMTVDKHIWSLSEYRRYVQKLSQNLITGRAHAAAAQAARERMAGLQADTQAMELRETDVSDDEGRQVYRL